ncbi:SUMO ligase siz1 [Haplosporangium gracile]|nr:SUMO ligase siz1 [Haplosporangium gracile]
MEDMLRQIRHDYHPNTEFFLWEFIADFHREYRDPGIMSKWQHTNAFVPRIQPLVENVTTNIFQNAFIPANPCYSPPLQAQSALVVGPEPNIAMPTTSIIPRSRHQPENGAIKFLVPSPNTDDVPAGNLSANARARLLYKPSPFYRGVMALTAPQYGRVSKNESVLTFKLQVSSSLSQQLMNNPHYSIMVFCASNDIPTSQRMSMEFPDDCYIRVNKQTLGWRPHGVKNKPGTFTPVDITRFCHLQESGINHVELRYSSASKIFHASLHLVCLINTKTIVDSLIKEKFVSKEATYQALEKKIKDDDIMELSSTLSLKCPLGVQRIEVPCRSSKCQHLQCFDAFTFLGINEHVQRWTCPVCNRIMDSWEEIIVDGYYMDILKSTPKSLKNVNVRPDGRWEIPAAIVPIDIDDSSILTDGESSSSGSISYGTDSGPIYVIDDDDDDDDDDDEGNQDGSNSSYGNGVHDTTQADLSMEAEETEVNGVESRDNFRTLERQESQPVRSYSLITISPTPASTLSQRSSRSRHVPEKSQFINLTLCSPDDVIDLTSDNEDENEEEENEEELVLHRRKRSFVQPNTDPRNEINDITLTTKDITLTTDKKGNTGSDAVKSRRGSNKHDNKKAVDPLLTASSNIETNGAVMEDLIQLRKSLPDETASTSRTSPKDPRRAVQGHPTRSYQTGDLQFTLPPTIPSLALVTSLSPSTSDRLSSPPNGDLTLLQFESAPFMTSSLDTIMEELSGNSGVPVVSESAIPSWPAYDLAFASLYLPHTPSIFGQKEETDGADGLLTQVGLSSTDGGREGEDFEIDGRVENGVGDGEGSEERPRKRPYAASIPSSHLSPELNQDTSDDLKSVLKQYLATPDIFL